MAANEFVPLPGGFRGECALDSSEPGAKSMTEPVCKVSWFNIEMSALKARCCFMKKSFDTKCQKPLDYLD